MSADTRKRQKTKRPGIYYRVGADGSKRYSTHYLDSTGTSRSKSFERFRDAEAFLDDLKARMRKGERIAPSRARFGEFADAWIEKQTMLRPNTRDAYRWAIEQHLKPRFENRKLSSIDVQDVADLIAHLHEKGLANWSIRAILTPLSRIMSYAVRHEGLAANPVRQLERGERPRMTSRNPHRILEVDEIRRLIDHSTGIYRLAIALGIATGLRQGELLGLKWGDIDFGSELIRVSRQVSRHGEDAPKTDQAIREVEILDRDVLGMLREHRLASLYSGDADYVFASATGRLLNARNLVNRGLDKAMERAGLTGEGRPKLTWHGLRRIAASMQIAAGYAPETVARQMGHANSAITLRIYSQEFDRRRDGDRRREEYRLRYGGILVGKQWAREDGNQQGSASSEEALKPVPLRGIGASGS